MEVTSMERTNEQIALRTSWVSILVNVLLSAIKLIAGIFGHSAAMLSDAIHSLSDVFSTLIVIVGVRIANKKPTRNTHTAMNALNLWQQSCLQSSSGQQVLALAGAVYALLWPKTTTPLPFLES